MTIFEKLFIDPDDSEQINKILSKCKKENHKIRIFTVYKDGKKFTESEIKMLLLKAFIRDLEIDF